MNNLEDYTLKAKRKFSENFIGDLITKLKNNPKMNENVQEVIIKAGEEIYFTNYLDYSEYIPGAIKFEYFDDLPLSLLPKVLEYFESRGNYIVKKHIKEYKTKPIRDSYATQFIIG